MDFSSLEIQKYEKRIKPNYSQKFVDRFLKFADFLKIPSLFFHEITIQNLENLNKIKDKQKVYVSNHLSLADFLMQTYLLHKNDIKIPRFIAGENLFHFPFNITYKKFGAIAVDRNEKGHSYWRTYDKVIKEHLRKGDDFLVYPEGGRNYSGKGIKNFKTGTFKQILDIIEEGNEIYAVPIVMKYDKRIEDNFLEKTTKLKDKRDAYLESGCKIRAKIYDNLYFLSDISAFFGRFCDKDKGNTYMNIGEPFSINKSLETYNARAKYFLASELKKELEKML
jgi:1-acyl-sn-glycerol-3-phosphate acyltransferase